MENAHSNEDFVFFEYSLAVLRNNNGRYQNSVQTLV